MNPYSTTKLVHHPEAIRALRERTHQNPTVVHFMPALACNHNCAFCSYGHRLPGDGPDQQGWKNMALMSDAFLPADKLTETCASFAALGVKAIELTGGGEPLIWPHVDAFFDLSAAYGWDLSLVTNGTALTEARADRFAATNWKWARVSIDAGSATQYATTRRVPPSHWPLAWRAVERLANRKRDPEQRVGVGYVVDRDNVDGVLEGIGRAYGSGADNVRIGMAFTPQGVERIGQAALDVVLGQIAEAKVRYASDTFQIHALFGERVGNLLDPFQDYSLCAAKEVLCVVGGDMQVYSCCSLAFNPLGLIGSFAERSFAELWWAPETLRWFSEHDAREVCRVPCLYQSRNEAALDLLVQSDAEIAKAAEQSDAIHRNYL